MFSKSKETRPQLFTWPEVTVCHTKHSPNMNWRHLTFSAHLSSFQPSGLGMPSQSPYCALWCHSTGLGCELSVYHYDPRLNPLQTLHSRLDPSILWHRVAMYKQRAAGCFCNPDCWYSEPACNVEVFLQTLPNHSSHTDPQTGARRGSVRTWLMQAASRKRFLEQTAIVCVIK